MSSSPSDADRVRAGAPECSPSVRVVAAFAGHADCGLARLAFAARVDLDQLLAGTAFAPPVGQSPHAFARGIQFERQLEKDDWNATRTLFAPELGVAPASLRIASLRGAGSLDDRARLTARNVERMLAGETRAPHLVAGAVLRAVVAGREASFEADGLAAASNGSLRAGEVKSFPVVDGQADPDKVGSALDQVATYLVLLRGLVRDLGGDPATVSTDAWLVTPRNVGLRPMLSAMDVSFRVARMEGVLASLPDPAELRLPRTVTFAGVWKGREPDRVKALDAIASRTGTSYRPDCLSSCGNALYCRARTVSSGSPCLGGPQIGRLLPGVATLGRVEALAGGAAPTASERPVAERLARAAALYDATTRGAA